MGSRDEVGPLAAPLQKEIVVFRSALLAAAAAIVATATATAQQPANGPAGAAPTAFEIRGKIVEEKSGDAIPRASVSLRMKGQTTVLTGAIAGPDGSFRLQGL